MWFKKWKNEAKRDGVINPQNYNFNQNVVKITVYVTIYSTKWVDS